MKKLLLILIIVLLMFSIAFELPPQLPSSFYGYVTGAPLGSVVSTQYGETITYDYQGSVVYSFDATGGNEGDIVIFTINGIQVAQGTYHIGSNQNVDLVYIEPIVETPIKKIIDKPRKKK